MTPDQRSLTDQMRDLVDLANQHRLYDAAAWVEQKFARRRTASRFRAAKVQQILEDTFDEEGQVR